MALWTDDRPEETNLMWYYAVYDGISMENRKDVKLYNAEDLLKEYTFVHGRDFLRHKDIRISRNSNMVLCLRATSRNAWPS